jgi:hypothetical protein
MAYPQGQYFMDSRDLWTVHSIIMEPGTSDQFLKLPDRKDSTRNDWRDEDGVEMDLSRVFFAPREMTLNIAMIVDTEASFWAKRNSFVAMLKQPGLRRLEIAELSQSFYVIYKSNPDFTRFTRIKQGTFRDKIAVKFSIVVEELQPKLANANVYVVTQTGKFIIA